MKSHFILNFGPQHPAAHGVLRLLLEISGEKIRFVDPHIGFLHRGTEKLIENKTILQSIPYFDRLDYVSTLAQEHSFILAVESLLNIPVTIKSLYLRTLLDEVTRILNHLMCITTHALDVGAITPFLWGFEEREKLLSIYELLTGARMHSVYYRVSGLNANIAHSTLHSLQEFMFTFLTYLNSLEDFLSVNSIWTSRLSMVGVLNKRSALALGCSGPVARSCGLPWDLRKTQPYAAYSGVSFNVAVSHSGDCYARYLVRMQEMRESVSIVNNCIDLLLTLQNSNQKTTSISGFRRYIFEKDFIKPSKNKTKLYMEDLISHFKFYSNGFNVPKGLVYSSIEAPKGEMGVLLDSLGGVNLNRCKIRSPAFYHLQSLDYLSRGHLLADVVTNIGSLDIVFGEVDR